MTNRVGFIGLGQMGMPMALHLLASGWELVVHDQRSAAMDRAVAAGAVAAGGVPALLDGCELIEIMVWDDAQLLELVHRPGGLVEHVSPGQIVIIHSTVAPTTVRLVAAAVAEKGARLVDAPISGGAAGRAATGELTLLVGGADADVARCGELFDALASSVFHVGPVGHGAAAKIVNNLMAIGNLLVAVEALQLARAAGAEIDAVRAAIASCSGASYSLDNLLAVAQLFDTHDRGDLDPEESTLAKDLALAVEAARVSGFDAPLASGATALVNTFVTALAELDILRSEDRDLHT